MKKNQVTYFEAICKDKTVQHYTKNTEDFENWVKILKDLDPTTQINYIAYLDGTTKILK